MTSSGHRVWVDGGLFEESLARISPFDHGLLTGDGVFETMKVCRSVPFATRRHLERLDRSAAVMGLASPRHDVLRAAMAAVVQSNGIVEGRIRITITGGPSPLSSERGSGGPTVIVAGGAASAWPAAADVVVAPWPRNEYSGLTGVKSISYGENVVALRRAAEQGAGEAIFANLAGNLCEGTGTNVFVGRNGRLWTPPLSSGCLAGVTRDLVCELVEVAESDLPIAALGDSEEAFLTSSTRDVQPIRAVDGRILPAAPGPLTATAAAALAALVAQNLDP